MPKSRVRKKAIYTPPQTSQKINISPRWLAPAMIACWILGILWIAVFYVAGDKVPVVKDLTNWNLAIGFGLIIAGVVLSTKWR